MSILACDAGGQILSTGRWDINCCPFRQGNIELGKRRQSRCNLFLGVFIYDAALDFPEVTGVVMWAAYFSGNDMEDYPRPALTLSGDIDGQTQITTIATSFQ